MDEDILWSWCHGSLCSCVPNCDSTTSTWSSLQRILWLLHSFRPDLVQSTDFCTEIAAKSNSLKVFTILQLAETQLGVPLLLDFSEINSKNHDHDDLTFFTYQALLFNVLEHRKPHCRSVAKKESSNNPLAALNISAQHFLWCPICQKDIRLLERFFVDAKVRHRKCFQCERCGKLLHVGLYRTTRDGLAFECLEHEKDDLVKKIQQDKTSRTTTTAATVVENLEQLSIVVDHVNAIPDEPNPVVSTADIDDVIEAKSNVIDNELEGQKESTEPHSVTSSAYPQLSTMVADNNHPLNEPEEQCQGKPALPTAPPRKKKPENFNQQQKPLKPLPPARTKLKAKVGQDGQVSYPEDKNPFGDEDEDDVVLRKIDNTNQNRVISARTSLSTNPFGSDDDINGSVSSLSSDNPFNDSDYDSEIAGASRRKSLHAPEITSSRGVQRSDFTKSFTAGSSDLHNTNNRSPVSTLTKKRPAPPPPPPLTTVVGGQQQRQPRHLAVKSPKETKLRKKRPAPPPPLPFRRQIRSEITMTREEISNNLSSIDSEILKLEEDGRLLEDEIRFSSSDTSMTAKSELIRKWLILIKNRMELVRRESEFAYLCRERQLDELHIEIEYQLRCIIEKPESEKREDDEQREGYLLQKLLSVIDEKSRLTESGIPETNLYKNVDDVGMVTAEKKKEVKTKKRMKLRLKKLKKKLISA